MPLLGPVSHSIQPGRFNSVLAMSGTSVPCSSIQHMTGVGGSLISCISILTAGKGGNSRSVHFLEVFRLAGPNPSFGV